MLAQHGGRGSGERDPCLRCALRLLGLLGGVTVETGVLDRNGGHVCEQEHDPLVLVREVSVGRLGEIEIAEDAAATLDRHAQERVHGRMIGREADGARIVGELVQTERARLVDEHAQDAPSSREAAEQFALLAREPRRDEAADAAIRPEHPEGAVGRAGHSRGGLDDGLQRLVEIESAGDRSAGLHDLRELVVRSRCGHADRRGYTTAGFPQERRRAPADAGWSPRGDTSESEGNDEMGARAAHSRCV